VGRSVERVKRNGKGVTRVQKGREGGEGRNGSNAGNRATGNGQGDTNKMNCRGQRRAHEGIKGGGMGTHNEVVVSGCPLGSRCMCTCASLPEYTLLRRIAKGAEAIESTSARGVGSHSPACLVIASVFCRDGLQGHIDNSVDVEVIGS
jgi:hypothetical protein